MSMPPWFKARMLDRDLPKDLCDGAVQLYLLCRPAGYVFTGTVDVDMVFTTDGWKILDRHHHSMIRHPLAGYLRCNAVPEADDAAVIRSCFGPGS